MTRGQSTPRARVEGAANGPLNTLDLLLLARQMLHPAPGQQIEGRSEIAVASKFGAAGHDSHAGSLVHSAANDELYTGHPELASATGSLVARHGDVLDPDSSTAAPHGEDSLATLAAFGNPTRLAALLASVQSLPLSLSIRADSRSDQLVPETLTFGRTESIEGNGHQTLSRAPNPPGQTVSQATEHSEAGGRAARDHTESDQASIETHGQSLSSSHAEQTLFHEKSAGQSVPISVTAPALEALSDRQYSANRPSTIGGGDATKLPGNDIPSGSPVGASHLESTNNIDAVDHTQQGSGHVHTLLLPIDDSDPTSEDEPETANLSSNDQFEPVTPSAPQVGEQGEAVVAALPPSGSVDQSVSTPVSPDQESAVMQVPDSGMGDLGVSSPPVDPEALPSQPPESESSVASSHDDVVIVSADVPTGSLPSASASASTDHTGETDQSIHSVLSPGEQVTSPPPPMPSNGIEDSVTPSPASLSTLESSSGAPPSTAPNSSGELGYAPLPYTANTNGDRVDSVSSPNLEQHGSAPQPLPPEIGGFSKPDVASGITPTLVGQSGTGLSNEQSGKWNTGLAGWDQRSSRC